MPSPAALLTSLQPAEPVRPAGPAQSIQAHERSVRSDVSDVLRLTPELAALIPGGCLRPGSTLEIGAGVGHTSLLLRLLATPTTRGAWATIVGLPDLNPYAALESGVALERLALIPDPGTAWLEITAALLDAVELVVLNLSQECRPSDARRLLARARQRHSVLILIGRTNRRGPRNRPPRRFWPEQPDLILTPISRSWNGLEQGHGHLDRATITVSATGRRCNGPTRHSHIQIGGREFLPTWIEGEEP